MIIKSEHDTNDTPRKEYNLSATSHISNKSKYRCEETKGFYERTFITFENEHLFSEAFKKPVVRRPPMKALCAITR